MVGVDGRMAGDVDMDTVNNRWEDYPIVVGTTVWYWGWIRDRGGV